MFTVHVLSTFLKKNLPPFFCHNLIFISLLAVDYIEKKQKRDLQKYLCIPTWCHTCITEV